MCDPKDCRCGPESDRRLRNVDRCAGDGERIRATKSELSVVCVAEMNGAPRRDCTGGRSRGPACASRRDTNTTSDRPCRPSAAAVPRFRTLPRCAASRVQRPTPNGFSLPLCRPCRSQAGQPASQYAGNDNRDADETLRLRLRLNDRIEQMMGHSPFLRACVRACHQNRRSLMLVDFSLAWMSRRDRWPGSGDELSVHAEKRRSDIAVCVGSDSDSG